MEDVLQYTEYSLDCEYAGVLNMQGLHMSLDKILYHA